MAKWKLEMVAAVGIIGYLGIAYYLKLFPFEGTIDSILATLRGEGGGLGGEEELAEEGDMDIGSEGPALNPATGSGNKVLSELELLEQMKTKHQTSPPLVTGDVPTSIYAPQVLQPPGGGVVPGTTAPTQDDEMEGCITGCNSQCSKLTGSAKTKCVDTCEELCISGGAPEEEEEESPISGIEAILSKILAILEGRGDDDDDDREEKKKTDNLVKCTKKCAKKYDKKSEQKKRKKCWNECSKKSSYAVAYPARTYDFIMPAPARARPPQMLVRGRPRTGFRSYAGFSNPNTYAGFDSIYGPSTIKVNRIAVSS